MAATPSQPPPSPGPAQPRPAATALLVRTAPDGLEVFMVQRHKKSGFLPNAWVFPGGRVDDADRLAGNARVAGKLQLTGLSEAGAAAYGVAAVRETFEESGIWIGAGDPSPEQRLALINGELPLAALLEQADAAIELDLLRPWAWWITPLAEPKRFDTRFLIAIAEGKSGRHDDVEVVDSAWVNPRLALAEADLKAFPVAPPTWWTLRELAAHPSAEAAFRAAVTPPVPILPIMQVEETSLRLLLPGHPDHGAPAIEGLPDRITYERGWVAWRGTERLPALPDVS